MSSKAIKKQRSFSFKETEAVGESLARELLRAAKKKSAAVIALSGDLGAGKTTFTQGFFRGLGLKKRAQSPTFIIMRRHAIPKGKFENVFHIDAYRLKKAEHLAALEFNKILADAKNIILMEWPERAKKLLPKNAVWISFMHGKKENERTISIKR